MNDVKWNMVPLGLVAKFHTGWTPPSGDDRYYGGCHKWANISDVGIRDLHETERTISDYALERQAGAKPANPGDLLFPFKLSIGAVSFAREKMYTNEAIAVFPPNEKFDIRFFYYALPYFLLKNAGVNIYGAPLLNATLIKQARVPAPPIESQHRIADFLDRETSEIDAAVADLDKYVELLEKRRRVVIINSVTGRCKESEGGSTDKLSSPTFMDDQEMGGIDWLGKVNSSWGYAPLFTLGSPKKTPNTGMVENNLLSLSYGRIVRRDIESSEGLVPASYENYQIVEPGDLVLRFTDLQNDQRSLRSGLVRERGIITSAYLSFTPDEKKLSPLFFAYLMRAADLSKVFYRMGSGVRQSLNWGELSLMRLPLPSLEVQRRIADYLDQETSEIDFLISKSTKLRDLLLKRRSVLITEVITGRKQV